MAKLIWDLVKHKTSFGFGKATDIWKISWNDHQAQSIPKLAHSLETFYCDDVCDDWSFISFTKEKKSNYEKFKGDQIFFFQWIARIWKPNNLTGMLFACF